MRRAALVFLTASLVAHVGMFGTGAWLAKHTAKKDTAPKVVFAGETFDIAEEENRREETPEVVNDVTERAAPHEDDALTPRPRAHVAARGDRASSHEVDVPLTYGALGDRSAADVMVSIARGFPQAASTDPIWKTVAFGDAGSAILEIEIEPDGTLARWSLGQGASAALRQAFARTMAFIGSRTFLARSAVTKLRVTARVSTDAVRDGADAVYAIHSEHEGQRASAYFSLSSGRRIDLTIAPVTAP